MSRLFDHDYHIHTKLSSCSGDPMQNLENILQYAKENRLTELCITDHYWDERVEGPSGWYAPQNTEHIKQILPFPETNGVKLLFGCETEMRRDLTLGISRERFAEFDFVIIPTTHMHMNEFVIPEGFVDSCENRARLWVERLDALLSMDIPFKKVGIAHLACGLINRSSRENLLKTVELISGEDMERLFKKAAELGCGIELNGSDMKFADDETDVILRPFRIAKSCGCKFYFGSDAHHPANFTDINERFERAARLLALTEEDIFRPKAI